MAYSDITALSVPLPEDIKKLKWSGDFDEAKQVISKRLAKDIPDSLRKRLELELEIIDILPEQYPYSKEEALELLRERFGEFSEDEFDSLFEDGAMDWICINGEVRFIDDFVENLITTRRIPESLVADLYKKDDEERERINRMIEYMKNNGSASYYFRIRSTLTVEPGAVREGETVKVHLPIPCECENVKNFKILDSSPSLKVVAPPDALQRTVYFEDNYTDGESFFVEYEFENHMRYVNPDPEEVYDLQPAFYLDEQPPHIMFTPYLKDLTNEIVGDEKNHLIRARKIYDYITSHVMYSYVRSYFAITDLVEYTAAGLKGDCGLQSLLFITMCRIAGVPARWQSGLYSAPWDVGCHDWAQFYVAPYGWLFADCSMGGSAYKLGNKERRDFYFGNVEPFRVIANSDFQQDFIPPKKFLCNDPYDNQVGEAELDYRGLKRGEYRTEHVIVESHII